MAEKFYQNEIKQDEDLFNINKQIQGDQDMIQAGGGVKTTVNSSVKKVKSGITTRVFNAASGTVTIAHGMGVVPSYLKFTAKMNQSGSGAGNSEQSTSTGTYDGINTNCIYTYWREAIAGIACASSTTYAIYIQAGTVSGSDAQVATVTMDATNFYLVWSQVDSPTDANTAQILWEAYI